MNLEFLKLDELGSAGLEVQLASGTIRGALGGRAMLQRHERAGRPARHLLVGLGSASVAGVSRYFEVRLHSGLARNEAAHSNEMPNLRRLHLTHRQLGDFLGGLEVNLAENKKN